MRVSLYVVNGDICRHNAESHVHGFVDSWELTILTFDNPHDHADNESFPSSDLEAIRSLTNRDFRHSSVLLRSVVYTTATANQTGPLVSGLSEGNQQRVAPPSAW